MICVYIKNLISTYKKKKYKKYVIIAGLMNGCYTKDTNRVFFYLRNEFNYFSIDRRIGGKNVRKT